MCIGRSDPEHTPIAATRRDALRAGFAATTALLVSSPLVEVLRAMDVPRHADRPWLELAARADTWLSAVSVQRSGGLAWPANPADAKSVGVDLYHGTAGVVLFYVEQYHATGNRAALETASRGADYLAAWVSQAPEQTPMGLYTGMAGVAYTLAVAARATKNPRHVEASRRALQRVVSAARPRGRGVDWNSSTDIISGSAGIGLFLLWAGQYMGESSAVQVAAQAGRRLIERGEPSQNGLRWLVQPGMSRNYPNFSHGAAGVSYFLATLHQATRDDDFLGAALAGESYLRTIATTTPSGGRMVYHSDPGSEELFYLSWCHGPVGTARLYHRLAEVTGDSSHRDTVVQFAQALEDMRIPDRSPGFWNNVSQCCGNSGVVEFLVDLHRVRNEPRWLEFAERVSTDTERRATLDARGALWPQAEHRVQPDNVVAQTGLMQGAAGVGLAMLHLDGALQNRERFVVLPDNPF